MADNERIASLETKIEVLKDLLLEMRDDLKSTPSRIEYESLKDLYVKLESEIDQVKSEMNKWAIKTGVASGIVGVIAGLMIKYVFT